MKRIKIRVSGMVQGVMFRASAREVAETLALTGFVRNESNSCVLIDAQGIEEKLLRFIEWCRQGPPLARVERIECEWVEKIEARSGFIIKYREE